MDYSELRRRSLDSLYVFTGAVLLHGDPRQGWFGGRLHRQLCAKLSRPKADNQMFLLPREHGKALALLTPLPTPTGWTVMGAVGVGDLLFDEAGKPCRVTYASPVYEGHECFEVAFSDGSKLTADAGHLWHTTTVRPWMRTGVRTTAAIARSVVYKRRGGQTEHNHSVGVAKPLRLPARRLPIEPYVLGAWLGDGTSANGRLTFRESDRAIVDEIALYEPFLGPRRKDNETGTMSVLVGSPRYSTICSRGRPKAARRPGRADCPACGRLRRVGAPMPRRVNVSLQERLRKAGLLGNKHIPRPYLRASAKQRLALLQGLMDTDGSISARGQSTFSTKYAPLRDGMLELLRSLGVKPSWRTKQPRLNGKLCALSYEIQFCAHSDLPVFRLKRKLARQPAPTRDGASFAKKRKITSVLPTATVPVRCVQVDSPSRLYLAGDGMIPTHNTTIISTAFPLWMAARNPAIRILIGAADKEKARAFLEGIRQQLAGNDMLHRLFGMGLPAVSRKTHFNVSTRPASARSKEPTFTGVSMRQSATSGHYDLAVIDDLVDSSNAYSAVDRGAVEQWYKELRDLLEKWRRSRLVLTGNRWHHLDQYGKIIEAAKAAMADGLPGRWEIWVRQVKEHGRYILPGVFNDETMASIIAVADDPAHISAQYYNRPLDPATAMFRAEHADRNYYSSEDLPSTLNKYIVSDLAMQKGQENDHTAFVCVGIDSDDAYWVIDYLKRKLSPTEQLTEAVDFILSHPDCVLTGIENKASGHALTAFIQEELAKRKIYHHVQATVIPNRALRARAAPLSHRWTRGSLRIRREHTELLGEMLNFSGRAGDSDDLLSALCLTPLIGHPPEGAPAETATRTGLERARSLDIRARVDRLADGDQDLQDALIDELAADALI